MDLSRLDKFLNYVLHDIADLTYRDVGGVGGSFNQDPDQMRFNHEVSLGVVKKRLEKYREFIGDDWDQYWKELSEYLSAPAEVLIKIAEERVRRTDG